MKATLGTGILEVLPEDLHEGFVQFYFKRVVWKDNIFE